MTAIRLKQAWKRWSIGHVFPDMPQNQAQLLIARGIAEPLNAKRERGKVRQTMQAGLDYITKDGKA
jgi:hypothetical protein